MAKKEKIPVDKKKLDSEIRKRGLNGAAVSKEMGYCRDYISTVKYEGYISPPGMKMLQVLYNITPEDIAPTLDDSKEDEGKPKEAALILSTETISRIEEAMYRAFKKALHE